MNPSLHVLFIGSGQGSDTIREALAQRHGCRLSVATSFSDLFDISKEGKVRIAILHRSLSPIQLREACVYIRRTWPVAKILVLGTGAEDLDDPLYDELVDLGAPVDKLVDMITDIGADGGSGAPNELDSYHVGRNSKRG
jgi:hypothetical protein